MGAVKIASKIVVMKDGKIAGIGDHKKLIKDNEDTRSYGIPKQRFIRKSY